MARLNKIRGKYKENEPKREKRDAKSIPGQKSGLARTDPTDDRLEMHVILVQRFHRSCFFLSKVIKYA